MHVQLTNSRIIWPMFNIESPNFTRTSMPTYSTATLDMTSSGTSGWHFSQVQKERPQMLSSTAFNQILVVRHFVCPTKWWASCLCYEDNAVMYIIKNVTFCWHEQTTLARHLRVSDRLSEVPVGWLCECCLSFNWYEDSVIWQICRHMKTPMFLRLFVDIISFLDYHALFAGRFPFPQTSPPSVADHWLWHPCPC